MLHVAVMFTTLLLYSVMLTALLLSSSISVFDEVLARPNLCQSIIEPSSERPGDTLAHLISSLILNRVAIV